MFDIGKTTVVKTVDEALQELKKQPEAVVICGGSDVLIKIREGKLAGCSLISIREIPELHGVRIDDAGDILIGPACTFSQVTEDPIVQKYIPALGAAVDQAGGPQLRNIGTIGGNVCNGVTSADSATCLLTLNAQLEITGSGGTRTQPLESFYKGPGRVNLEHGELLTAIRIKKADYEGFGGHYIKYAMRNAMDIATLGCTVHVKLAGNKNSIEEMRLAYGVAAPTPIRCPKAEAAAKGKPISEALCAEVGAIALTEVNPRTSWRASKEFRQQLVQELAGRALKQAVINAGGEPV